MKMMADGDMPLVTSYGGSEVEFNSNGTKTNKNSRMSNLIFWGERKGKSNGAPNGRNWIHDPNALVKGHVAYLVKFLGCTQVDQPKGIEVVKDAIKKLQFAKQLKKSEAKDGAKCKKVEITISMDGVAIQEPRSNNIMYQFPLHRISYCADDKGAKKFFSFIAKGGSTVNGVNGHHDGPITEKHECFVFISTKLASEITLTIGQAFDLAYRRFLNDNGKYIEMQKLSLQNRKLELQMNTYKTRLLELSKITYKDDLTAYLARHNLTDIAEFKPPADLATQLSSLTMPNGDSGNGQNEHGGDATSNNSNDTSNSSKDFDLLIHSTPTPLHNGKTQNGYTQFSKDAVFIPSDDDSDFDPRAPEPAPRYASAEVATSPNTVLLNPPPKNSKQSKRQSQPVQAVHPMPAVVPSVNDDLFGSKPFSMPQAVNPSPRPTMSNNPNYDIADFNLQTSVFNSNTNGTYDPFDTQKSSNIFGNGYGNAFNGFGNLSEKQTVALGRNGFDGFLEDTITEMKDGFSRGITFGNDEDFSLDNLDPLKKH